MARHAGLSIILKDVTEERRLREQVLHAEKLRAVGEMAAGIAHNFNNVLTTILTRAQLLAPARDRHRSRCNGVYP